MLDKFEQENKGLLMGFHGVFWCLIMIALGVNIAAWVVQPVEVEPAPVVVCYSVPLKSGAVQITRDYPEEAPWFQLGGRVVTEVDCTTGKPVVE